VWFPFEMLSLASSSPVHTRMTAKILDLTSDMIT